MSSVPNTTKTTTPVRRRLGFFAVALACGLIATTGDATARQGTPEERAYCAQLYAKYVRYHFNLYHMDGWATAQLAQLDCGNGNVDRGIRELELILQRDGWPSDRPSTSIGSAPR